MNRKATFDYATPYQLMVGVWEWDRLGVRTGRRVPRFVCEPGRDLLEDTGGNFMLPAGGAKQPDPFR